MTDRFTVTDSPNPAHNGRAWSRRASLGAGVAWVAALAGCAAGPSNGAASGSPGMSPDGSSATAPRTRPPKIGLALGGGAARGFAHVGVIQVLEQNGIVPDLIVGTSAGSLVAALYASGKTPAELERAALQMEEAAITDWTLPLFNRGMLRGEALARYVNQQVRSLPLQDMKKPLGIVATELATGRPVLFQRGDTGSAVRASSAVPGVFTPVSISGRDYVDGGLVAPVPVRQARQMGAEFVIAVDISSAPEGQPTGDAISVLLQTFNIMGHSINQYALAEADVVVRPALMGVGSADFAARQRSMAAGRDAMQAQLSKLREQLQNKRQLLG